MPNSLEFPVDCLYQLENSVFTDNWSIPYKKDEWLDRLLQSTIFLLKEDMYETNANCMRFLERVMPEVYRKLLSSSPVNRWNSEIQCGVYNMTRLAIELIALRLNKTGVPDVLLNTLHLIFNRDTEFNTKNIPNKWDRQAFIDKLGPNSIYTVEIDTYGWLLNLINLFGYHNGFVGIVNQIKEANNIHVSF
jgi:ubiquitin carboxyl-terminal hydrolase 9/24